MTNNLVMRQITIRMPSKTVLRVVPVVGAGPSLMRQAATAEIYAICGLINIQQLETIEQPENPPDLFGSATAAGLAGAEGTDPVIGAYVGEASKFGRAAVSYRNWVDQMGAIEPRAIVLVHRRQGRTRMSHAERLTLEAAVVRNLGRQLYLTNIRSSTSAVRDLSREQVRSTEGLAIAVTEAIVRHVFGGRRSPLLGGTQRTQLIRLVREHGRVQGLDARQIVDLAHSAGLALGGETPTQTCRRDLQDRARADRVEPPVFVTWHQGRTRVFFHPDLGQSEALRTYRASREICA